MKKSTVQYSVVIATAVFISILIPQLGYALKPLTPVFLFIILFLSGLNIKYHEILNLSHESAFIALISITRIVAIPIIVFLTVGFINPVWQIPLTLLVLAPVGVTATLFTGMLGGKRSTSLALTTITGLLAPFWIPIFSFIFFEEQIQLNWLKMISDITLVLVIPVIMAELFKNYQPKLSKQVQKKQTLINYVILTAILVATISPQISVIQQLPIIFLFEAILFTFATFVTLGLVGWGISRLRPKKEEVAVITSYLLMNYVLSMYLATNYFSSIPLAVLVSLLSIIPWNLSILTLNKVIPLLKKNF